MISLTIESTNPETDAKGAWGRNQIGDFRFLLLRLCILCQLLTVIISWPLWQVRTDPPLLPVVDMPFQIPFGIMMLVSAAYIWIDPKRGLWIHLAVMAVASLFDQMRLQPQFLAIWMMMFATVLQEGVIISRWFLPTMWLWAGIHKALSPDWNGMVSWSLLERSGLDGTSLYVPFAVGIAAGEIVAGLIGIFKPKWGIVVCPALHFGIMVFLSPLFLNWNYSVLPWNFCTAIVGAWVMYEASCGFAKNRWEKWVAAAFLILPAGFYVGWMDHGYANVLYSDSLPKGVITKPDRVYEIVGWDKINVPFPNERRLLKANFQRSADPNDKFHLYDPRPTLPDQYFVLSEDREMIEIDEAEFFSSDGGQLVGNAYESGRSLFDLGFAGARLLKKTEGTAIYAIEFDPKLFRPELLDLLQGLKNLEQVQLANCDVGDADMKKLANLHRLSGIGLNNTRVTDQGLKYLKGLQHLTTLECQNTQITGKALAELFAN